MNSMATAMPQNHPSANISRLLTAAVINQSFRHLLLTNPEKAINNGYNGESFRLERDEKELILSIQATSLTDFAVKISGEKTEGRVKLNSNPLSAF
jgi:hypothetical protein